MTSQAHVIRSDNTQLKLGEAERVSPECGFVRLSPSVHDGRGVRKAGRIVEGWWKQRRRREDERGLIWPEEQA
jgi:hypothetical protein